LHSELAKLSLRLSPKSTDYEYHSRNAYSIAQDFAGNIRNHRRLRLHNAAPEPIAGIADTFTKVERSRIMAAVKGRDTTPEMVVRRLVHGMGFRYRLHVRALPGTPDLVFPRLGKVINVSGCFWHMHGCGRCRIPVAGRAYWTRKLRRNWLRDRRTRRALRRLGWCVLVVWECQTVRAKRQRLAARLAAFLGDG